MATTKHGLSRTPEYRAWAAIRHRCLNPEVALTSDPRAANHRRVRNEKGQYV